VLVYNVNIKTLKMLPTCFDLYSDHPQGARSFLVKVTEFKITKHIKYVLCQKKVLINEQQVSDTNPLFELAKIPYTP
jgi:hypothetical protein